jgi:large subunit ribosomal protein L10
MDIVVHQGPTPFGPGPIIGELQKLGLPASIDGGKIVVRKDTTLVKEGEPIPANVAAMLPKLEILPMIVGLDLRAAYEDGTIYHRDVLNIPEDYYTNMFATAAFNARALGVAIAFPTTETITPLITKAFREAMGLSITAAIPTKDNIKMLLAKADSQMLSIASAANYTDGSIGARLNAAASVAAAAPAAAPAAEEKVEDDTEEEVSEEEAAAGLSALFG